MRSKTSKSKRFRRITEGEIEHTTQKRCRNARQRNNTKMERRLK